MNTMTDDTPAVRPVDHELVVQIVRACDHAGDLKELVCAVVGLGDAIRTEFGRGFPAVAGLGRVAQVTQPAVEALGDELDELLEAAKGDGYDEPHAPARDFAQTVLDEIRTIH